MGLFVKSVKWLSAGIRALKGNRELAEGVVLTVFRNNTRVVRRVERFFEKLHQVETLHGQHTGFWDKVRRGFETGSPVTLTIEEARYAHMFKRAFDDTVKPLGKRIADRLAAEVPGAAPVDLEEIADLTRDEDSDSNLA